MTLHTFMSFNPYSNGSSFFITSKLTIILKSLCFNPYSNGSSFFIGHLDSKHVPIPRVSILILMDLPFLFSVWKSPSSHSQRFNPYSNGSSFFITGVMRMAVLIYCFNPYSNGSSFFIVYIVIAIYNNISVSILILMDLPFLFSFWQLFKSRKPAFQSLF